ENFILRERTIASGARCLLAEKCKIGLFSIFRPKVAANGTVKFKQPLDAPAQLQRRLSRNLGRMCGQSPRRSDCAGSQGTDRRLDQGYLLLLWLPQAPGPRVLIGEVSAGPSSS